MDKFSKSDPGTSVYANESCTLIPIKQLWRGSVLHYIRYYISKQVLIVFCCNGCNVVCFIVVCVLYKKTSQVKEWIEVSTNTKRFRICACNSKLRSTPIIMYRFWLGPCMDRSITCTCTIMYHQTNIVLLHYVRIYTSGLSCTKRHVLLCQIRTTYFECAKLIGDKIAHRHWCWNLQHRMSNCLSPVTFLSCSTEKRKLSWTTSIQSLLRNLCSPTYLKSKFS